MKKRVAMSQLTRNARSLLDRLGNVPSRVLTPRFNGSVRLRTSQPGARALQLLKLV